MSSDASASLPAVGDVFSSVIAFKLACHRAAPEICAFQAQFDSVPFPSSDEAFSSAHALLARLYAYAQERGFSFFRKSHLDRTDANGYWRISSTVFEHGHGQSGITSEQKKPSKRNAPSSSSSFSASSSDSSSEKDQRSNKPSPAPLKKPRASLGAPLSSSKPALYVPLPSQAELEQSFPSDLTAFLTSFLPAPSQPNTNVALVASALLSSSIGTLPDLLCLLEMGEPSLEFLLLAMRQTGTPESTCFAVKKVLEAAKQSLARETA
ncbi:hypothetical protein JCM8547_000894 [Rhodosporidiobolus lusitaniae]